MPENECTWFAVCPMKQFWIQGRITPHWIESFCRGRWETCVRFQLERDGIPHPDNMLPDGTIDAELT